MPPVTRGRAALLAVPALVVMVVLAAPHSIIVTPAAPQGILSYEFALSASRGRAMVRMWDVEQKVWMAFMLGLDYLFMPAYAAAIWAGCELAAQEWPAIRRPSRALGKAQFVAAALDAVENAGLFYGLLYPDDSGVSFPLAAGCATGKFVIVGLGLSIALLALAKAFCAPGRKRTD